MEEFDAVVVGLQGQSDAPHVPNIPGLAGWAHKFPNHVYHVREYRTPEDFSGKVRYSFIPPLFDHSPPAVSLTRPILPLHQNVLIVGDYLSGSGVAIDLAGYASSITVSARVSSASSVSTLAMLYFTRY